MDLRTKEDKIREEIQSSIISENFINFVISDLFDELNQELYNIVFNFEPFIVLNSAADMFDVLVAANCFSSRGEAKKNWKKTNKNIEDGLCSFVIGKKNFSLTIFKPIH